MVLQMANVMGQCIERLEVSNANKGENEIYWQPHNCATGLFFIKVQCHEFTKVIKRLFVK